MDSINVDQLLVDVENIDFHKVMDYFCGKSTDNSSVLHARKTLDSLEAIKRENRKR